MLETLTGNDLARALAAMPVPFYVLDAGGRFRWLNSSAIDLIGERALGQPFLPLVAPEHRTLARVNFARKIVGRTTTGYDLSIIDRDGKPATVRIASAPLRDGDSIVGVFGFALPIDVATRDAPTEEQLTLTPRQQETLKLLAAGLGTKEIAVSLGVAEETARNHIRALLRRLGVHSRLEALVVAQRLGLVD
jgi:PAS domain S-box-containing protein